MMTSLRRKILLLPVVLFAVACQDSPIAPELGVPVTMDAVAVGAPSFSLTTTEGQTALVWNTPLASDLVSTRNITKKGGVVSVSGAGLSVTFPENAIRGKENITVRAHAGSDVAFEFQPHGTHFGVPVRVAIELDKLANSESLLDLWNNAIATRSSDMMVDGGATLVPVGSISAVYYAEQDGEVVQTLESFTVYIMDGEALVFFTDHFSGYALAA